MKLSAAVAALGLSILAVLGTAPGVSRAEMFQADFTVSFYPPNPCGETCSFEDRTLNGIMELFFQQTRTGPLISLGRTNITGVGLNTSRTGSFSFDVDLSDGPGDLLLTFGGFLTPNPGPPDIPFYAFFTPNPGPPEEPTEAPLINLGVIGVGVPNPGPPDMPLYAFASPGHDIGTLALTVNAIPEPEIYAMLSVGLGLMGWVGRRRRLQTA